MACLGYLHPGQNLTYYRYVELSRGGKGDPVAFTGMSWSAHRPRYTKPPQPTPDPEVPTSRATKW